MAARNYKLNKPGGLKPGADPADIIRKFEKVYTNIFASESSGSMYVAREIENCIREKQKFGELCILGITTGKSPVGVFRALVEIHKKENLSFRNVVVFSLDEFFPISPKEQQSRNWLIHESLLDHVDILPENIHIPDSTLPLDKVAAFCRDYEAKIEEYGGLDLLFLGTGVQGQLGFNEPGSYTNTRTRLVALGNESRQAVSSIFYGIDNVPRKAITMGLGTILKAKRIILMAWGEEKATVIKDIVEGEENSATPATCLQKHPNIEVVVDEGASQELTRVKTPWLVGTCLWPERFIRTAVLWLCRKVDKPILKLTYQDYIDNRLGQLLEATGQTYDMINIQVFNDLQHTITGWPGGKPNADDTYRPERAKPYPKRVVVFSPHPDDDVISMGGTIRRLVEQKHDVHVAYETSGNIAVGDEEVIRFLHFINGFNQIFNNSEDQVINDKYAEIRKYLKEKKDGDMDTRDILTIKGLIRRGEARTACTYNNIPLDHCHFLDLPFYETGKIQKNPISEADVEIVRNLLREVKPHQIFVAGDLADPHGTHRVCTDAVFAAIDLEKEEGAKWLKECRIWMYRGAWAEWEIENIEMAVPISPEELRAKRNSILKHQSQMESAPFLGNDERLFWQRSEDRNRGTAALYDSLGLASYEAMEAFVEYIPL